MRAGIGSMASRPSASDISGSSCREDRGVIRSDAAAQRSRLQIGRAGELVGALDLGHVDGERLIPVLAPMSAGHSVINVGPPSRDRLLIPPVRHRDPQAVGTASRIHAEETRLLGSQYEVLLRCQSRNLTSMSVTTSADLPSFHGAHGQGCSAPWRATTRARRRPYWSVHAGPLQ